MAIATTDDFFAVLEKSKLLSEEQLEQARELAAEAGERAENATAVARLLAKRQLLTRWQAGQLLAGRTTFFLGKYKLIDLLGRGGMGSVFLGEHVMMNRRVAIKVLNKQLSSEPGALERFLSEARAIAALDHPNIVHAYNVDQEGDRYYIVMEYVDGTNLEEMVKSGGPLDCATAAEFIRQAAEGLAQAHKQNIVHCDIKPSNLVVNQQRVVKILDMGLARLVGRNQGKRGKGDESVLGSVDYLAPEQALESDEFDHRADIYALGCTLYFLLTGRPPFPDGSLHEKILKHQREKPTPIEQLRPDAPQELIEVCQRMMAKDPARRYQSAEEVVEAIESLALTPKPKKRATPLKKAEAIDDGSDSNAEFPAIDLSGSRKKSKAVAGAKPARVSKEDRELNESEDEEAESLKKPSALEQLVRLWRSPRGKIIIGSVSAVVALVLIAGAAGAYALLVGSSKTSTAKKPAGSVVKPRTVVIAPDDSAPASADAGRDAALGGATSASNDDGNKTPPENSGAAQSGSSDERSASSGSKTEETAGGNSSSPPSSGPAEQKPQEKPAEQSQPEAQPTEKPAEKPPEKPQEKPAKPAENKKSEKPPAPPKYEPFKDLGNLKAITLPKVPKEGADSGPVGETVEVGPIKTAPDKPLGLQLLGGGVFKAFHFELVANEGAAEKSWYIAEQAKGPKSDRQELARVVWEGEKLVFQWLAGAVKSPARANQLRNCGLKLSSGDAHHFVAFNAPQPVPPILLDFDRPKPIPVNIRLETQPEQNMLRVELKKDDVPNMKVEITPPNGLMLPPVTERGRTDTSKSVVVMVINEKNDKVKKRLGEKDEEFLKYPLVLQFRLMVQGNQLRILWEPFYRTTETGELLPAGRLSDIQAKMVAAKESLRQAEEVVKKPPQGMTKDQAEQFRKLAMAAHEGFTGLVGTMSATNKSARVNYTVFVEADGERVELASTEVEGAPPPKGAEPESPPDPLIDQPSVPKRFFD